MIGITKSEQLKRMAPLKPKEHKEPKYLSWLHAQMPKCFSCGSAYHPYITELHHVKLHSSDKKDDRYVIPLCGEKCHKSGELSPHGNPRLWRKVYPIEIQREYAKKLYEQYKSEN